MRRRHCAQGVELASVSCTALWCSDVSVSVSVRACRGCVSVCDEQKRLLMSVAGSNIELSEVTVRIAKLQDDWQNFDIAIKVCVLCVALPAVASRDEHHTVAVAVSLAGL